MVSVLTGGDNLLGPVSSELRGGEPIRHFHGVFILRGNGRAAHEGEHSSKNRNRQHPFALHRQHLLNQV